MTAPECSVADKRCNRCGETKSLDQFPLARNRRDGLYPYCKKCHCRDARKYYYAHREKVLAASTKRRSDPAFIERDRIENKREYWENRAHHLGKAKEWNRTHRAHRREYIAKWNAANRERVEAYRKRHKALKRNASCGELSAHAWRLIVATFRGHCVYCGKKGKLEQDHVVALKRGGAHAIHNVVPACRHCNATKFSNAAPPFWWVARAPQ